MSELFKNKYRIPSARLQTWDYAQSANYFITICTANREHYFGDIKATIAYQERQYTEPKNLVVLTDLGRKAEEEWLKTQSLRPDMNLELGEHIVMPNHFHGIISINDNPYNIMHNYGSDFIQRNYFKAQSKNLASIIRGFKSAVTMFARKNDISFDWQPRFYDRIIRDQDDYVRATEYILRNPDNWQQDEFYIKRNNP